MIISGCSMPHRSRKNIRLVVEVDSQMWYNVLRLYMTEGING